MAEVDSQNYLYPYFRFSYSISFARFSRRSFSRLMRSNFSSKSLFPVFRTRVGLRSRDRERSRSRDRRDRDERDLRSGVGERLKYLLKIFLSDPIHISKIFRNYEL